MRFLFCVLCIKFYHGFEIAEINSKAIVIYSNIFQYFYEFHNESIYFKIYLEEFGYFFNEKKEIDKAAEFIDLKNTYSDTLKY